MTAEVKQLAVSAGVKQLAVSAGVKQLALTAREKRPAVTAGEKRAVVTGKRRIKGLCKRVKYLFYTKRCVFCGRPIAANRYACSICAEVIARPEKPLCRFCGNGRKYCSCGDTVMFYDEIVSPFYYEGAAKTCIGRLKFRNKPQCARQLGSEMARKVTERHNVDCFDLVTCIPMTENERRARGYNQSELLAKEVSKETGIPFDGRVLTKLYKTKAQRTLGKVGRSGNVFGVFASKEVTGRSILLCDDIRTTGATLNECAKMLLLAGAWRVVCVTAAVSREKH